MKFILTRPLDDSLRLARKLEERGHEGIIAPLLKIIPRPGVNVAGKEFRAIAVTSANALHAGSVLEPFRSLPLYCVGPQSADAARAAGFSDVRPRGGNVDGLARMIARELHSREGPILYASGSETSGDLEGALSARGFEVERVIVYDAVPLPLRLGPEQWESADGVLLYSARSARLWAGEAASHVERRSTRLLHYCLSENVARQLPKGWPARIANRPDEDHMLTMLDQPDEAE